MVEEIRGKLSNVLKNKNIIHCVTSSISLYKAIDIARYLIKHGANVIPVLSYDAAKLISPYLFEYATGNKPVYKITGNVEHTSLFKEYNIDLVLVAPATANTISKIANGISDTPVTLVASVALGKGIPILIAPAMHEPMYENRILLENIEMLKKQGISFVEPKKEEGKAKLASEEDIFYAIMRILGEKPLRNKKVIVTAGATREYLDSVRFLTNAGSGKMGIAMAKIAWFKGADVYLIHGDMKIEVPNFSHNIHAETSEIMLSKIEELLRNNNFEYFVSTAAIADFKPLNQFEGKIESKAIDKLIVELIPTKKIIKFVKEISPKTKLVAFKAEYGLNKDLDVLIKAYEFCDFLVINDISRKDIGFSSNYNEVIMIDLRNNKVWNIPKMKKDDLAENIWSIILSHGK